MTRHVVFGTGQVGAPLARRLVDGGHDVVAVNRTGRADLPGARIVAADASDPVDATLAAVGADVVYFCLNAGNYAAWPTQFPPLQRAVLDATIAAGARLVVLDNLYAYGPQGVHDLVETMPAEPTSAKAATRATMTAELLDAHRRGLVDVSIGRASDYFGPGVRASALGETVFGPALRGGRAQVMGNPRTRHSYSYVPDVVAGLVALGTRLHPAGRVWHLPVAPAVPTTEIVDTVFGLAGHPPRLLAAGRTTVRAIGMFRPAMREYLHTLYQFTDRWVVDDSRFRSTFGIDATPLDAALAATLAWYREPSYPLPSPA